MHTNVNNIWRKFNYMNKNYWLFKKCFFKLKENDLNKKEFSKLIEEVEEIIGINLIIPKNGE